MTVEQEKPKDEMICSFCGKTRSEVRTLIVGPSVYICDGCVWVCVQVIAEEGMRAHISTLEAQLKAATEESSNSDAAAQGDPEATIVKDPTP